MKTLILLLTAAMSAPAFAQSGYESETTRTTNSSSTVTPGSAAPMTNEATPMDNTTSGALTDRSGSSTSDYNSDYNTNSGSSTTDLSNSSNTGSTYNNGTTTYESGSSTMAPSTESMPSATAPAAVAPTTTTTSDTTTSRTYREDSGAERVHGGFYIEPGIVGTREDADLKSNLAGGDTTGTANSVAFDLKLGAHINDMFFAGLDGRYGRSSFEDSSYQNVDATTWNWGPTVGANAPYFGGRVWASYIVEGNYDPDQGANNVDLRFRDPYGWRVGGGIRLSSVSLNLEYQDLTYRTTDVQSAGSVALNDSGIDFAQRGYALSLSFPIDL